MVFGASERPSWELDTADDRLACEFNVQNTIYNYSLGSIVSAGSRFVYFKRVYLCVA